MKRFQSVLAGWIIALAGGNVLGAINDCVENIVTNVPDCNMPATVTFTNITMSPGASAGAPYASIVCGCDSITATLQFTVSNSTEITTINGQCPSPWTTYSTNSYAPLTVSNRVTWAGGTNGGNSITMMSSNAAAGDVTFEGVSAQMPTNSGCGEANFLNSLSKSYAFVAVSSLSPDFNYVISASAGPDAWYVCAESNASITVTATPDPGDISEPYLPSGWVMSGGSGAGKLQRAVDISHVGSNVVSVTSGCSGKTNTIIVVKADIAETEINACACSNVVFHLTGESSTNTVWALSPTNEGGALIVSSDGSSATVDPGTNCGSYTITAGPAELGGSACQDSATLTVYTVSGLWPDRGTPVTNEPPTWVVCAVPTNAPETNLVVTASPCPGVSHDTNLPACWQMSGGLETTNWDGTISRTRRLVDITTPGTNMIVAAAGCSRMTNYIVVEKTALSLARTNVFVNRDDDNANGTNDLAEFNGDAGLVVSNENDLVLFTLKLESPARADETVTLSVSPSWGYYGHVRVWDSPLRGPNPPVLDSDDWNRWSTNWSVNATPTNLWVEGVGASADLNDVTIDLQTEYGCAVSTNMTVIDVAMILPSGNATSAPSDPDRLCYSDDYPVGMLQVTFKATVAPASLLASFTNRVRFEADAIAGSTQGWSPDNLGGQPVVSNGELAATLYYTNLPPSNSAFGLKFARVKFDGAVQDTKCFWAFYPADAYNYPGCSGPPYDEDNPQTDMFFTPPNYFFYYLQTAARYGNPLFDYRRSHQTWPWEYCPPQHTNYYVEIGIDRPNWGPVPSPGVNAGDVLKYIDRFAWACRHEAKHSQNYVAWWGSQCYSQTNDVDFVPWATHGDAIPNWIEPGLNYNGEPYSPTNAYTFAGRFDVPDGTLFDDDQLYTSTHAEEWTPLRNGPGESDPNDWSKPGNNWPE